MTVPPAGQSCGTCANYFENQCHADLPSFSGGSWPAIAASEWCSYWLPIAVSVPPPGQTCATCINYFHSQCRAGIPDTKGADWPAVDSAEWCRFWGITTKSSLARVLLNTLTADNTSPNLDDTTSLTAVFPWYEIVIRNLLPTTTDNALFLLVHSAGAWAGANYTWGATAGDTKFNLSSSGLLVNNNGGISGTVQVFNPAQTASPIHWMWQTTFLNKALTGEVYQAFGGAYTVLGTIDGFRLTTFLGDNWASGTVEVYGML